MCLFLSILDTTEKMTKVDMCACTFTDTLSNVGGTTERVSGSSEESGCSSRKRARKEGLGGGAGFFDLNLPADVV